MKKKILLLLVLVLVLSVVGCGEQKNPEDTVKKYFEAAKDFDEAAMNSYVLDKDDTDDILENEESGTNNYLLDKIKENAKKLEYEILSSKIENDSAYVDVKVEYMDSSELIIEAMSEYFVSVMQNAFSDKPMTDEEVEDLFVDTIEAKSKSIEEKMVESEITINLVKNNNEWLIEEITYEMQNAITSNIIGALTELDFSEE